MSQGQIAKFHAQVLQALPEISARFMQFLIEHPTDLKKILAQLAHSLDFILSLVEARVKVIEVHPAWDFVIVQSPEYPEVGVAMSRHHKSLGDGAKFVIGDELMTAPCGCCGWFRQLQPYAEGNEVENLAVKLVEETCETNGVKILLIHCPQHLKRISETKVDFVDPYGQLNAVDSDRFHEAFPWLNMERFGKPVIPLWQHIAAASK